MSAQSWVICARLAAHPTLLSGARTRRSVAGKTEFLLRTVIGGNAIAWDPAGCMSWSGPDQLGAAPTAARPVTPRAGLGRQDTAPGRWSARRRGHGRLLGLAPRSGERRVGEEGRSRW